MRAGAGGGEFVNGEDCSSARISSSASTFSAYAGNPSGAARDFSAVAQCWVLGASVGAAPASELALAMAPCHSVPRGDDCETRGRRSGSRGVPGGGSVIILLSRELTVLQIFEVPIFPGRWVPGVWERTRATSEREVGVSLFFN